MEKFIRDIVNETRQGIWIFDESEKKYEFLNHTMEGIIGMTSKEVIQNFHSWEMIIFSEDRKMVRNKTESLREGESVMLEYRILSPKGNIKWVCEKRKLQRYNGKMILTGIILDTYNGVIKELVTKVERTSKIGGKLLLLKNVEARRKAEAEVEKLSLVARYTSNLVIITDEKQRIEWVNDAFVSLTGYTLNEVKGKVPGHILQGSETNPETIKFMNTSIMEKKPCNYDVLNYTKNGSPYWVNILIQPVFNKKRELIKFFSIQSDITEQKKHEKNLTEAKNKLDAYFNSSTNINFFVGKNYEILAFNKSAADTIYNEHEKMVRDGDNILDYSHNKLLNSFKKNFDKSFEGEKILMEIEINYSSEKSIWWKFSYLPVYDQSGLILGVSFNAANIDFEKRATLIIEYKNKILRSIAYVQSHKLRAPVATIMGLIQLFDENDLQNSINKDIIGYLKKPTEELDMLIHEIVDKTYMAENMYLRTGI